MNNKRFLDDQANDTIRLNSIPSVNGSTKRRGWDGEHLEFERVEPTAENLSSHAAVNLEQFRNNQIGVGYQAKHVIRQPSEPKTSVTVVDASKPTSMSTSKKQLRDDLNNGRSTAETKSDRLQRYLKCEGLRKFRKELASIED